MGNTLYAPGGTQPSQAAPAGNTKIGANNFRRTSLFKLLLTSDGTGNVVNNVANADVLIWPGICPANSSVSGNKPDGTHLTLTSAKLTSSATELASFMFNYRMHITKITITTSDTTNFTGGNSVIFGMLEADGQAPNNMEVMLNGYKNSTGNGISDTIIIDDVPFITGLNFFMKLTKLALSSNMSFVFEVESANDNVMLQTKGL